MDEVELQLKSHKVTERRKGRRALEALLEGPRRPRPDRCLRLLNAAAQFVEHELNGAQARGRAPAREAAVLFRKCVSAFGKEVAVLATGLGAVFKHVLCMLQREDVDGDFVKQYADTTCELLQSPQLSCKLDASFAPALFTVIEEGLKNNIMSEPHLRLLRVASTTIRLDMHSMLPSVMCWVSEACQNMSSRSDRSNLHTPVQAILVSVEALNKEYGSHMGHNLVEHCGHLINLALQQMPLASIQHRDVYAQFFLSVLDVLDAYAGKLVGAPTVCGAALIPEFHPMLEAMFQAFCDDELLRHVILYDMQGSNRSQAVGFVNALRSPRSQTWLGVASRCMLQTHLLSALEAESQNDADQSFKRARTSASTRQPTILDGLLGTIDECYNQPDAEVPMLLTSCTQDTGTQSNSRRQLKLEVLLWLLAAALGRWHDFLDGAGKLNDAFIPIFHDLGLQLNVLHTLSNCINNVHSTTEQGALLVCLKHALQCFRRCFPAASATTHHVSPIITGVVDSLLSKDLPFDAEFNRTQQSGLLEPLCELYAELCRFQPSLQARICRHLSDARLWVEPSQTHSPSVLELLALVSSYAHVEGLSTSVCANVRELSALSQSHIVNLLTESTNECSMRALLFGVLWLKAVTTSPTHVRGRFAATFEQAVSTIATLLMGSLSPQLGLLLHAETSALSCNVAEATPAHHCSVVLVEAAAFERDATEISNGPPRFVDHVQHLEFDVTSRLAEWAAGQIHESSHLFNDLIELPGGLLASTALMLACLHCAVLLQKLDNAHGFGRDGAASLMRVAVQQLEWIVEQLRLAEPGSREVAALWLLTTLDQTLTYPTSCSVATTRTLDDPTIRMSIARASQSPAHVTGVALCTLPHTTRMADLIIDIMEGSVATTTPEALPAPVRTDVVTRRSPKRARSVAWSDDEDDNSSEQLSVDGLGSQHTLSHEADFDMLGSTSNFRTKDLADSTKKIVALSTRIAPLFGQSERVLQAIDKAAIGITAELPLLDQLAVLPHLMGSDMGIEFMNSVIIKPWDGEWNFIGLHRLLLSAQSAFTHPATSPQACAHESLCDLVLSSDAGLQKLFDKSWRTRIQGLEAAGSLFTHQPAQFADQFQALLLRRLGDTDSRVRQTAISWIPILTQKLDRQARANVKEELLRSLRQSNAVRLLRRCSHLNMIASFGMTDAAALQWAVSRLFLEVHPATAAGRSDQGAQLLALVRTDRSIVNALEQLARTFNLRNVTALLAEMKMSIAFEWWRESKALQEIPAHWFGFASVQELLQASIHLFVPVCCFLPSELRWGALREMCRLCGTPDDDHHVAELLRSHLHILRALRYLVSDREARQDVKQFLQRVFRTPVDENLSAAMFWVTMLPTFLLSAPFPSFGLTDVQRALRKLGAPVPGSSSEPQPTLIALGFGNLVELLTNLRTRLLDLQGSPRAVASAECLMQLAEMAVSVVLHRTQEFTWPACFVAQTAFACLETCALCVPSVVTTALHSMAQLLECLSKSQCGTEILEHVIADNVVLAVQLTLQIAEPADPTSQDGTVVTEAASALQQYLRSHPVLRNTFRQQLSVYWTSIHRVVNLSTSIAAAASKLLPFSQQTRKGMDVCGVSAPWLDDTPSIEAKILAVTNTAASVVAGLYHSDSRLLLELQSLSNLLDIDALQFWDGHEHACIKLLNCLSNVGRVVQAPSVQAIIVDILGMVGRPPMNVASHDAMHVQLLVDLDHFRAHIIPILLSQSLAADAPMSRTAVRTLREVCETLSASSDKCLTDETHMLLDYQSCPPQERQTVQRTSLLDNAENIWEEGAWRLGDNCYRPWLCSLVSGLVDDVFAKRGKSTKKHSSSRSRPPEVQFLASLRDICATNWRIAEMVFPFVCAEVIAGDDKDQKRKLLSDRLEKCVLVEDCKSAEAKALVVKTFNLLVKLEIAEFVEATTTRRQRAPAASFSTPSTPDRRKFDQVLDLDLWTLANVATQVGCHCSALQIIELAIARTPEGTASSPRSRSTLAAKALTINRANLSDEPRRNSSPADVLLQVATRLHDDDVVLGLPLSNLPSLEAMVFERHGDLLRALSSYDSLLQQSNGTVLRSGADAGVRRLLKSAGAGGLLHLFEAENVSSEEPEAAKLIRRLLAKSVHAVQFNDDAVAHHARDLVAITKRRVSDDVFRLGHCESLQALADQMLNLQLLRECEEMLSLPTFERTAFVNSKRLPRWKARIDRSTYDSITTEQILSHRFQLLSHVQLPKDQRLQCLLTFAQDLADKVAIMPSPHTMTQLVDRIHTSIMEATDRASPLPSSLWWWLISEAKAAWAQQRVSAAFLSLQSIATALNYNTPPDHVLSDRGFSKTSQFLHQRDSRLHLAQLPPAAERNVLLAEVLSLLGDWSATLRRISSERILREYLQPAEQLLGQAESHTRVRERLADYFVELYNSTKSRMESAEWSQSCRLATERKAQLEELRRTSSQTTNGLRQIRLLERECKIDDDARDAVERSTQQYLCGALQHHLALLQHSKQADTESMFTLARLWLQNSEEAWVNDTIGKRLDEIASFKFLSVAYQLCSRLSVDDNPSFQTRLQQLVVRIVKDHPHHVMLYLLSIKNGESLSQACGLDQGYGDYNKNVPVPKIQAASSVLRELESSGVHPGLLDTTTSLVQAYISLAHFEVKERKVSFNKLPTEPTPLHQCLQQRVFRRGGFEMPTVITRPPPVRPNRDYSDVVRVRDFGNDFEVSPSGISRPKIVYCAGTDGRKYKQLVKTSTDDLRQDAVMQQVFLAVNGMLMKDPECNHAALGIRTYAVVPLSPNSGVLEWVDNTQVFGDYLIAGSTGAHGRYHPEDWTHQQCRRLMKEADGQRRRQAFNDVYEHFSPVFRNFFLERFPHPQLWYSRRTNYVRSVAVSSIVGYILGIGDRHAYNILLDKSTAEVVHIDFGITFEQGKVLTTPETVPFRLTRDIVDGMGVTGTEGTLRRSCERVLTVLKNNATTISTILEVIIHDPMFRWLLSPVEIRRRQQQDADEPLLGTSTSDPAAAPVAESRENGSRKEARASMDAAERALLRVKQKLQGYEDPSGVPLGVHGHVNLLINMAQDPENLCRIFPGWAPWL